MERPGNGRATVGRWVDCEDLCGLWRISSFIRGKGIGDLKANGEAVST